MQRRKSKSPLRGHRPQAATAQPKPSQPPVEANPNVFDHTLQTIPEVQSEAENTFAGSHVRPTTPANVQDSGER